VNPLLNRAPEKKHLLGRGLEVMNVFLKLLLPDQVPNGPWSHLDPLAEFRGAEILFHKCLPDSRPSKADGSLALGGPGCGGQICLRQI
jgi:hypothetical protein